MQNKLIIVDIGKYSVNRLYKTCQYYFFQMIEDDFLNQLEISYLLSIRSYLRFCQKVLARYIVFNKLVGRKKLYKKNTGENYITVNNYNMFVSFSYSKEFIVECFSNDRIGVDVEKIVPSLPLSIINRNLMLKSQMDNGSLTRDSFTKLWTVQESYCKYAQVGLNGLFKKDQIIGVKSFRLKDAWISYIGNSDISTYYID